MNKAVIVTPFDNYSYNVRIKYIYNYLKDLGYTDVYIISSDWDHRNKCTYHADREGLELIHVPEYKKNISLQRIYSHFVFSSKVYDRLCELKPDFIYASVPPNFLVRSVSRYRKIHTDVKLIFEVGDLWPETLPIGGIKKMITAPIMNLWSCLRDRNINNANGIIYECNLFKDIVGFKSKATIPQKTLYLCKENKLPKEHSFSVNLDRELEFAYVGSINNIIDIDLIVNFLSRIKSRFPVKLHIIGAGENLQKLCSLCKKSGVTYMNHGIIFDDSLKYEILKECTFGFNIMKKTVVVGATMKSLEYFHWGIAVINNIPADSSDIVTKYNCGFNITGTNIDAVIDTICKLSDSELTQMRLSSRKVYLELFDERIVSQQFKQFYNEAVLS